MLSNKDVEVFLLGAQLSGCATKKAARKPPTTVQHEPAFTKSVLRHFANDCDNESCGSPSDDRGSDYGEADHRCEDRGGGAPPTPGSCHAAFRVSWVRIAR